MDLQVTALLGAGQGELVLAPLGRGDDVDPERGLTGVAADVGLRAVDLVAVDVEMADAVAAVGGPVGDQQVLAREAGRAVHLNSRALGERGRAGGVTWGRARLRVRRADAQHLESGVLA